MAHATIYNKQGVCIGSADESQLRAVIASGHIKGTMHLSLEKKDNFLVTSNTHIGTDKVRIFLFKGATIIFNDTKQGTLVA